MKKIIKYVIIDILRSKIVLGYTAFLLVISFSIFNLEDNSSKGLLSLLNIILIIVPLVSILFSAIYVYNSAEFLELLVSQPLKRKSIWLSLFVGLAVSMSIAFFVGVGIPIIMYESTPTGYIMLAIGILLSIIFVSIALFAAVITRDKAKGIGVVMLMWLYFSLLFDGLVLFILFQFADYPLEKAMVFISAFNPIDLGRILILLKMDVSALMGYTGAVFKDFFGTQVGFIIAIFVLIFWAIIPLWISVKKFKNKDL
ncbi:MAG: ABC transporter permease subunit [Ferruginibacter sp.]